MVRSHAHVPILIFHFFSPLYDRWRYYAFRDFWKFQFRFSLAPQFIQALPNRFGRVLRMNPLEECQKVCWSEFSGWSRFDRLITAWVGRVRWDRSQSRKSVLFWKFQRTHVQFPFVTSSSCGPQEEILRWKAWKDKNCDQHEAHVTNWSEQAKKSRKCPKISIHGFIYFMTHLKVAHRYQFWRQKGMNGKYFRANFLGWVLQLGIMLTKYNWNGRLDGPPTVLRDAKIFLTQIFFKGPQLMPATCLVFLKSKFWNAAVYGHKQDFWPCFSSLFQQSSFWSCTTTFWAISTQNFFSGRAFIGLSSYWLVETHFVQQELKIWLLSSFSLEKSPTWATGEPSRKFLKSQNPNIFGVSHLNRSKYWRERDSAGHTQVLGRSRHEIRLLSLFQEIAKICSVVSMGWKTEFSVSIF